MRRMLAACFLLAVVSASAQVPTLINYQGRLASGTNLYNGNVDLRFRLFTQASGGTYVFESTNRAAVIDGIYSSLIGEYTTSGTLANALSNPALYLEVAVDGATLAPRERISSAAYALGAWGVAGNAGTSTGVNFIGTTDNMPLDIRVNNTRVLRLAPDATSPNILGGYSGNTISTGVYGAVLAGGGRNFSENKVSDNYSAVGGGRSNTAGNDGGPASDATEAVVAGGLENQAGGNCSAVPGGRQNKALGDYSFAAGRRAKATNTGAFVWADSTDADFASTANNQFLVRAGGGMAINTNPSPGDALTIGGGVRASGAAFAESFIGDGSGLTSLNGQNLIMGSVSNAALGPGAVTGDKIADGTITEADLASAGYWKTAGNEGTTGGVHFIGTLDNESLDFRVNNESALRILPDLDSPIIVGGNSANTVSNSAEGGVVAGGGSVVYPNRVSDEYGTVSGGRANRAGNNNATMTDASYATVAGGYANTATNAYATISGGNNNRAGGYYSTVPGGDFNWAAGMYSLAAGRRARAYHDGTFVWGDTENADVASTSTNQFIIRARGGVGIGETSPRAALSVGANLDLYSGAASSPGQASIRGAPTGHLILNARSNSNVYVNYDSGQDTILNLTTGSVGIGTNTPGDKLTVAGSIRASGVAYAESFVGDGSGLTSLNGANLINASVTPAKLSKSFWELDGNSGTTSDVHFIGTTDNEPFCIRVNNRRVLKTEWDISTMAGPNWIAGYSNNSARSGADGATIAGGGSPGLINYVSDNFGTIGGGRENWTGDFDGDPNTALFGTIAGGVGNLALGHLASIGGGADNQARGTNSAIGGGYKNIAVGFSSVAGGGFTNRAEGHFSTVGGGATNTASGTCGTVAGGSKNEAEGDHAAVGGGHMNLADGAGGVVAGGASNEASGVFAAVGGGAVNKAESQYSSIGGGRFNSVNGVAGVVAGGYSNKAFGYYTVVGGGATNLAYGNYSVIAGGIKNEANAEHATIGGGQGNLAGGDGTTEKYVVIGGGGFNRVDAEGSVIAGGVSNSLDDRSAGYGTIGGGLQNVATGDYYATVGGGTHNRADGQACTVAGGATNLAGGPGVGFAFVGGGRRNTAGADHAAILGGLSNDAGGPSAAVGGGRNNEASGEASFVGGGSANDATGYCAVVAGGATNDAMDDYATVGGGLRNRATNIASTVSGGADNRTRGDYATVGGGLSNTGALYAVAGGGKGNGAMGDYSVVAGGYKNRATDSYDFIGGGQENDVIAQHAVVAGGQYNLANGDGAVIGGGSRNTVSAGGGAVGGGYSNRITDLYGTVAGGYQGNAGSHASVGGGNRNSASGDYATIPGGQQCEASGSPSFAAGRYAKATHNGSFVWGDSQFADVTSSTSNEVTFRCQGGVRFLSGAGGANQQVAWQPGDASWTFSSDRDLKENFAAVDSREVLEKVARMPITEWNYKGYETRHMGPMAQDFRKQFELGRGEKSIDGADLHGVSLAAIQGLYQVIQTQQKKIDELEAKVTSLQQAR